MSVDSFTALTKFLTEWFYKLMAMFKQTKSWFEDVSSEFAEETTVA